MTSAWPSAAASLKAVKAKQTQAKLERALVTRVHETKKQAIDYALLWSRYAERRPHYNRMDPDPDPESDLENDPRNQFKTGGLEEKDTSSSDDDEDTKNGKKDPTEDLERDQDGNIKKIYTRDDWRKFWAERVRKEVNLDHLTDKDIADAVDRYKRMFLKQREADRKPHIDPDLPECYYWDKYQVAKWAEENLNIPNHIPIKEIILCNEISGRRLITLDANTLVKLGVYELPSIKLITKEVRDMLGIPPSNTSRAVARQVPLEKYLHMKTRTGIEIDKMTFRGFCEANHIDYDVAKKQMENGYRSIIGSCQVILEPLNAEVKWIPISREKPYQSGSEDDSLLNYVDSDTSIHYLYDVPTVEELCDSSIIRNAVIPPIISELVERVYEGIAASDEARENQRIADEIFKEYMDRVYSDFSVFSSEERLKFITIIAEELADDIANAKEVLEDIESFQNRLKSEGSQAEMENVESAVSLYVQSVMPLVVNSAMKELEEKSSLEDMDQSSEFRTSFRTNETEAVAESGTFHVNHQAEDLRSSIMTPPPSRSDRSLINEAASRSWFKHTMKRDAEIKVLYKGSRLTAFRKSAYNRF